MVLAIKTFDGLELKELYQILQLRSEVFVVEQDCVYQDMDNMDYCALHIMGIRNNTIMAYTRIFKPGDYYREASIGRVIVKKTERGNGYASDIMHYSLKAISERFGLVPVRISAQKQLINFYNSLGFVEIGNGYLEDGIPHIAMLRE